MPDALMLQAHPSVAVVINTYNQAKFLGEAIRSVLQQSVPARDIVVVDDGSSDHPQTVVAQYPSVRLVAQRNAGLAAARNLGMSSIASELVTFLDADDLLLPGALAAGLACFAANPEAWLVYGAHRRISEDGGVVSPAICVRCGTRPYLALLKRNCVAMHGAAMYRRTRLQEVGGFDVRLRACEDYDLYFRIARAGTIICHPEVVADYRRHRANMSSAHAFMLRSALEVQARYRPPSNADEDARRAFREGQRNWRSYYSRQLLQAALRELRRGCLLQTTTALAQTLVLAPLETLSHLRGAVARAWRNPSTTAC